MFARIVHTLQIFPLLMFALATVEQEALVPVLNHSQSVFTLIFLSSLGFVSSLGLPSKLKKILLNLSLTVGLFVTLNFLFYSPTVGVLSTLVVVLALINIGTSHKSKQDSYFIPKNNVLLSFILYLAGLYIVTPNKVQSMDLLNFALVMAGASVIYVSLIAAGIRKFLSSVSVLLILSALLALFFSYENILKLFANNLFWIAFFSVGYLFINRSTLKAIRSGYENIFKKPELIIVGYFVLLAFVGTFLLQLSYSQTDSFARGHAFLDSLFVAMSAVSVTGLTVLDLELDFTFFGQATVLLLIQLGGLGITSLSAWILLILKDGRLNLTYEDALHNITGSLPKTDIKFAIKKIFIYFVTIEAVGALALTPSFLYSGDGVFRALWRALFTSISAFCNAGFSIQSKSLIPYQTSPFVLLVVGFLIVAGGFAPLLVLDLPRKFKYKYLGLQEKIVLSATLSLIVIGFSYFLVVEWGSSLAHLGIIDKMANAFFHSVSPRTAGFNSIELTDMKSITQMFYTILMFIGGNPGSTAGGIKTVTFAVLVIASINALKEGDEARAFFKKIPYKTVFRALLVLLLGALVHFVFFFFLSMTQDIEAISLLFETFSALGTVGLSLGATLELNEIGKIIIIFCMLVGRVGPLTFILLLTNRQRQGFWKVPQEDVFIT